jgi:hypothetical protein
MIVDCPWSLPPACVRESLPEIEFCRAPVRETAPAYVYAHETHGWASLARAAHRGLLLACNLRGARRPRFRGPLWIGSVLPEPSLNGRAGGEVLQLPGTYLLDMLQPQSLPSCESLSETEWWDARRQLRLRRPQDLAAAMSRLRHAMYGRIDAARAAWLPELTEEVAALLEDLRDELALSGRLDADTADLLRLDVRAGQLEDLDELAARFVEVTDACSLG